MDLTEYKRAIRKCSIRTITGPASDNFREVVIVDWAPYFGVPGGMGQEFLLGIDPTLPGGASWINDQWQYAPAPAWAAADTYIDFLEARIAELEKK